MKVRMSVCVFKSLKRKTRTSVHIDDDLFVSFPASFSELGGNVEVEEQTT